MAEAAAQVDRIRRVGAAETDIEIAELKERAAYRFANEEMTKQLNMENIINKALQALTKTPTRKHGKRLDYELL